jgi:glycosyltransferase involved in cell wall biosynthesis
MNVLLVNNQVRLGGAETVVHQLWSRIPNARLMVADGAKPPAEVMYPPILSRFNHSRLHEITETLFPTFDWTNRRFAALKNDPADIIHIHNFHGNYAAVEALGDLSCEKRVVWTFHGLWGVTGGCDHPKGCDGYLGRCGHCPQLGSWPIGDVDRTEEELSRKIAALASSPLTVIAPSKYFLETIRSTRVGSKWKLHHIPNGIDPERFKPSQARSGKLKILLVNRNFQDPHKGFSMIEQALHQTNTGEFELLFVGCNSAWAAKRFGERGSIRAFGYVVDPNQLAQVYGESHIFLFASPAENFPCVILEAMASGCCVVATPSGGVVEQITDGENGFLAENISGDSLAAALDRAKKARNSLAAIGERARRTVIMNFSEKRMIEAHLRLYQKLMESGSNPVLLAG